MAVLMGLALSYDLRIRVVSAWKEGLSAREVGLRFGVSASTAVRWVARAKSGDFSAYPSGRRRGSRLYGFSQAIIAMVEGRRDITLDEMVVCLMNDCGVKIGRSALSNWLRGQGYTLKKRPNMHWSKSVQT